MNTSTSNLCDQIRTAFPHVVRKYALTGPDGVASGVYGCFRTTEDSITPHIIGGSVSKDYTPHKVEDICAFVEAGEAAFGTDCKVTCRWDGGETVIVQPSVETRKSVFKTDTLWPRLKISGGYGGKASFNYDFSWMRDACLNMSQARIGRHGVSGSLRHTSGLYNHIPAIVAELANATSSFDRVIETAAGLAAQRIDMAQFIREVYPLDVEKATSRKIGAHERMVESIMARCAAESAKFAEPIEKIGGQWMANAWIGWNAIQGYVQHDTRRQGSPDRVDRALLALRDTKVQTAWNIALETAV